MGYCDKCVTKYGDYLYVVFRALIGVLFFMHGWSKFAGGMATGLFLVAAIVEVVAGWNLLRSVYQSTGDSRSSTNGSRFLQSARTTGIKSISQWRRISSFVLCGILSAGSVRQQEMELGKSFA